MNKRLFLFLIAGVGIVVVIGLLWFPSSGFLPRSTLTPSPTYGRFFRLQGTVIPLGELSETQISPKEVLATLLARPEPEYPGISMPTRLAMIPDNTLQLYMDSSFGFSFYYPANWQIEHLTTSESYRKWPENGYALNISNFPNLIAKQDKNPDEILISMYLYPKPEIFTTLEDWVIDRFQVPDGPKINGLKKENLGKKQVITWTSTDDQFPQGDRNIAYEQRYNIYYFSAYPSTSSSISMLNDIVNSLN
jgi:hypothetical protein